MIFRFGCYRLDTRLSELRRDGTPVPVEPQVFDLLRFLIENRDGIVGKDEIIDAVWDGRIVSEATLSSRMNAVRRAVGDDGKRQEVIRTLPRRGFRFVQPVAIEDEPRADAGGEPAGSPALGLGPAETHPAPSLADKPSIAVLPFRNLSGDPEQEYFSDGICDDIITELSRNPWLFVIARNSVFSFKGGAVDVKRVGRELGVRYVVEGSVRRSEARLRVVAQLVDTETGRHVWAERYDRELDDVFAVQDEITEAIVGAVAPSFVAAEARRVERKVPESFDAWDYAMRGTWHLWRFGKDNVTEATRLFDAAIALDAKCSAALSGLSIAYTLSFLYGWADDLERTRDRAREAAMRAIAADANDAWAHSALCLISAFLREFDTALSAGGRALELNPNLAFAEGALANIHSVLGDYDDTMLHADRAERLSPRDPARVLWNLARSWAAILSGRYEDSVAWARKMVDSSPDFPTGWRHLAADYALLGRLDEARRALRQAQRLAPGLSIATGRARVPYAPRSRDKMERYLDGLRAAGLPEE